MNLRVLTRLKMTALSSFFSYGLALTKMLARLCALINTTKILDSASLVSNSILNLTLSKNIISVFADYQPEGAPVNYRDYLLMSMTIKTTHFQHKQ